MTIIYEANIAAGRSNYPGTETRENPMYMYHNRPQCIYSPNIADSSSCHPAVFAGLVRLNEAGLIPGADAGRFFIWEVG